MDEPNTLSPTNKVHVPYENILLIKWQQSLCNARKHTHTHFSTLYDTNTQRCEASAYNDDEAQMCVCVAVGCVYEAQLVRCWQEQSRREEGDPESRKKRARKTVIFLDTRIMMRTLRRGQARMMASERGRDLYSFLHPAEILNSSLKGVFHSFLLRSPGHSKKAQLRMHILMFCYQRHTGTFKSF